MTPTAKAQIGPMLIPSGWREIVRTARAAVDEGSDDGDAGAVVEATGLDDRGRLLLRISSNLPARARGVAAAAHALSGEICDQCGGPGDPVRLAGTPTRTTRCDHCRGTADEVLPRLAWRRHRDVARETPDPHASHRSYRNCPVVEDILTDEDLAALMEVREHDGWPMELAGGVYGMPYWLIWGTGWNALIRAAFTLLLSLQCDGQAQPLRLGGTCRGGDPSGPSSSSPNPCVLASLPASPRHAFCRPPSLRGRSVGRAVRWSRTSGSTASWFCAP